MLSKCLGHCSCYFSDHANVFRWFISAPKKRKREIIFIRFDIAVKPGIDDRFYL